MTEKVSPSANKQAEAFKTAGAIASAEGEGYVVGEDSPSRLVIQDLDLVEDNMSEFNENSNNSSMNVTIDAGEAFIYGAWVAIDEQSVVTLNANQNNQAVYVGWSKDSADEVIIGREGAFSNSVNNRDPRIKLWEFNTDGNGVVEVRDFRTIGRAVNANNDGSTTIGRDGQLTVQEGDVDFPGVLEGNFKVTGPLNGESNSIVVGDTDSESQIFTRVRDTGGRSGSRSEIRMESVDTYSEMKMARTNGQSNEGEEIGRVAFESQTSGGSSYNAAEIRTIMMEDQTLGGPAQAAMEIHSPMKILKSTGWSVGVTESSHQGHGRYFKAVDAVYDSDSDVWRARTGYPTTHAGIGLVNHYPGDGLGTGNVSFAAAPETTEEGEVVEWREMTFDHDGILSMKDGGIRFAPVSTPASPSDGWIVYTDDEDGRLKARDSNGNVTTLAS